MPALFDYLNGSRVMAFPLEMKVAAFDIREQVTSDHIIIPVIINEENFDRLAIHIQALLPSGGKSTISIQYLPRT